MQARVLGRVDVVDDELHDVSIGGRLQARLLAILIAAGSRSVSVDDLVAQLWPGANRPADPVATLRTYVGRLRTAIGPECITTMTGAYRLAELDTDVARFEALVERARRASGSPTSGDLWGQAVGLWRGPAFDGHADADSVRSEASRLEELRAEATEAWFDARLAAGEGRELAADVESAADRLPLREGLRAQQMTVLARAGRQADALRVFQDLRHDLTEVGLEPSPRLVELDREIAAGKVPRSGARRTLRGYELGDRLGAGAFAQVWLATQASVGREVAIKQIRAELADEPEFIRQFESEAHLVARLEHPHIVPLYDYWREPGSAYLVMRYLDGGSLAGRLLDGRVEVADLVPIVTQVAAALDEAHRRNVIHRDVKPANILLDAAGNAYLSDFGIAVEEAERLDPEAWLSNGSPAYAPPEQLQRLAVGPAADVYALGVTVYEALTGALPFPTEATMAGLLQRQLNDPLPRIRSSIPEVPAAVDSVIRRATAKDPRGRHARASDFARDLAIAAGVDGSEAAAGQVTPEDRNPYKGLAPFDEADAADFSGRNRLVGQLVKTLGSERCVAVVGPSGAGKSSVVRAGLLPSIRQGAIPGSERWFVTTMIPGSDPFADLEVALLRVAVDPPPDLVERLRSDVDGLARVVHRLVPDGRELVLVIDQFEELFTLAEPGTARQFLDRLVAAVDADASRVRLVVTLRADFYDHPLRHPGFARQIRDATVPVLPLAADELERAITEPAAAVGATFEPGLVAEVTADVADQPGALPLLQYTLTELYDRRDANTMTREIYEELGGVGGSIARRAEEIFESWGTAEREATRRLFGRLVALGEGTEDTGRRAIRAELVDDEATATVVDRFSAARLLAFDRDPASREPTVEVGHEALIREWPRLRAWLDEDRDGLRILRHLTDAARNWAAGGREDSDLYRGSRLDGAAEWAEPRRAELNPTEVAFLDASQGRAEAEIAAERRHLGRLRRLLAAVAVVAAMAMLAGGLALVQRGRANDQAARAEAEAVRAEENADLAEQRAEETESARADEQARRVEAELATLVASATAEATNRPELAMLLAVEAYRRDPGPASQGALLAALNGVEGRVASYGLDHQQTDRSDGRCNGEFGPGLFVSAGLSGLALIDASDGTIRRTDLSSPCSFAVTNDGRRVAAPQFAGELKIWDVESNELIAASRGLGGVADVSFSPDGTLLAAATGPRPDLGDAERLFILDASTGEVVEEVEVPFPLHGIDWASTGEFLFFSQPGPQDPPLIELVIRNGPSGSELLRLTDLVQDVPGWAFSGDGTKLLIGDLSLAARIIDLTTGEVTVLEETALLDAARSSGAINHDGSQLALGMASGVQIIDATTGEAIGDPVPSTDVAASVSFLDDETLAIVGNGGVVEVIDLAGAGGIVDRSIDCCWGISISAPSVDNTVAAIRNDDPDEFGVVDMAGGTLRRVTYDEVGVDLETLVLPSSASNGEVHLIDRDLSVTVVDARGEATDRFDYFPDRNVTFLSASRTGDTTMWLIADLDEPPLGSSSPGREEFVITDLETRGPVGPSLPFDPENRALSWLSIPGAGALLATETELVRYDAGANLVAGPVPLPEGGGFLRALDTESLRWLASTRADGTVDIWDVETLELVQTVAGVDNPTWIRFVNDGRRLVFTDGTGRYLLYDRERETSVGWLLGNQPRVWDGPGQLTPDGAAVWLTVDGQFKLVPLDPDVWRDRACALVSGELTEEEWAEFIPGDEPRRDICP